MKKLTNKQVLILVGHSAYCGDNGPRMCFSKAQAVRVLRNRGYFRNQARAAVNKVMLEDSGYATVSNLTSVTEVRNEKYSYEQSYYNVTYEEIKKYWSDKPEA